MFKPRCESALFIDFDNMHETCLLERSSYWLHWLSQHKFPGIPDNRKLGIRNIYWNNQRGRYTSAKTRRIQRSPFTFHSARSVKDGRSVADPVISFDMAMACAARPKIQVLILMTSDKDFIPVIDRIQDLGRDVIAIVKPQVHAAFHKRATAVIDWPEAQAHIDDLASKDHRQRRLKKNYWVRARKTAVRVMEHLVDTELGRGKHPQSPIAHDTIKQALGDDIFEFATSGPGAYLGYEQFADLMLSLAKRTSAFRVETANGSMQIYINAGKTG